jgi:TetR/AcrR family tetracycline transcriptional repressor
VVCSGRNRPQEGPEGRDAEGTPFVGRRDEAKEQLGHPYLVRLSIGRIPKGPNVLRYSERMLAILPPRLAVASSHLLIATVNGFTLDETGVGDQEPDLQEAADMARDYLASLPADSFPTR